MAALVADSSQRSSLEMSSNADFFDDNQGLDICRVCRSEGLPDRPLFHPCICTGSIKWIHQECLIQWMRYSRKEYCELCSYRFSFTPIYSPDMPRRLPLRDVVSGLLTSVATAVHYWLHTTLVVLAWIGVVPIAACRIYRVLFSGSIQSVLELLSVENMALDMLHGGIVVTCTLLAFIGLVWLREQILHGGALDWVENPPGGAQDVNIPLVPHVVPGIPAPDNNNQNAMNVQQDDAGEADPVVDPGPANPPEAPIEGDFGEVAAAGDGVAPAGEAAADEANWNPIEWDRAAEDLTWERLLGLDGSLVFLEHVFWVVSLNTLFILLFAYIPYHVGHGAVVVLGLHEYAMAAHFEGLVTTLCGYCAIGMIFVILQGLASLFGLIRTKRFLRLCYIVVKVSLLTVVELGILPLICGWWLDICSLSMFDATLKDREASFRLAPGTDLFIHWLVGMVYVYYFASFILLLREVLRPGVLWFLRNLNDPDFSPIQEMIHLPILRHIRRLVASVVIFGMAVLLMLWVPVRILRWAWPTFLPYTVALHSDTQVNELSLELLLLQVILPALLEQSHSRIWLKWLVGLWCRFMAWSLDLHSYLLGDEEPPSQVPQPGQQGAQADGQQAPEQPDADPEDAAADDDEAAAAPAVPVAPAVPAAAVPAPAPPLAGAGGVGLGGMGGAGGLGAAHHALFQPHAPTGYRPYKRPSLFWVRLVALVMAMGLSLVLASLIALTVPVWVGRRVMNLCLVGSVSQSSSSGRVHELYTAACGMYLCWLGARAFALMLSWLPQGRAAMIARVKQWFVWSVRAAVAFSVLLGLVPLLFGLLLELVVVVPLRVSLEQSAVLFMWQDWALGVLYTKIACAIAMMGPEWFLRRTIERAYRDGIRNMDLRFILNDLAAPLVFFFGLALSIPYATAHGIVPLFVQSPHMRNLIARRIYPFVLLVGIVAAFVCFQIRQFRKLYNHIKDSKYLVGRRLVNYDPRRHKSTSTKD